MLPAAGLLFALAAAADAHIGAFCDGCFGSNRQDLDAQLSQPLNMATGDQSQWFFRGLTPDSAKGTMTVSPGGTLDVALACSKTNSEDATGQACFDPSNGSLHRRPDGTASGCALAVSYKPFEQIAKEDLQVVSVIQDCPRSDRQHSFELPADLPAGSATAAFMWIPPVEAAADEMYMTGIRLDVQGDAGGSISSGAPPAEFWGVQGVDMSGQRPVLGNLGSGALQLTVDGAGAGANASVALDVGKGAARNGTAASSSASSGASVSTWSRPASSSPTGSASSGSGAEEPCKRDAPRDSPLAGAHRRRGVRHTRRQPVAVDNGSA